MRAPLSRPGGSEGAPVAVLGIGRGGWAAGRGQHQENCKFAFSAFPSRKSGKKRKKQGNYGIVKQDPRRSSAKSMKSSASFPDEGPEDGRIYTRMTWGFAAIGTAQVGHRRNQTRGRSVGNTKVRIEG